MKAVPKFKETHIESLDSQYFKMRYDISVCFVLGVPGDEGFYVAHIFVTDPACPIEDSYLGEAGEWDSLEEARAGIRKFDSLRDLERDERRFG